MLKKTLTFFFVVFFLLIIGAAAFLLTFNLDHYRPQIEKKIAEAVGNPVRIGKLSLAWRQGVALSINDLRVLSNDEPVLKVDRAGAVLELMPLIKKQIQIASLFLDGAEIRIIKQPEGRIEIQGIRLPETPVSSEVSVPEDASPVKKESGTSSSIGALLVDRIQIENVHVLYQDDTPAFPVQLDVRKVKISVSNVSLFNPIDFDFSAAVFSGRPNVTVSGRLRIKDQGQALEFDQIKAATDLDTLDWSEVARSLPAAMAKNPGYSLGGKLAANIENLQIHNGKPDDFEADLSFSDGKVSGGGPAPLMEKIQLNIKRFKPGTPFDFKLQAAVLSRETDLSLQGKAQADQKAGVSAGPVQADLDLNLLDWNRLTEIIPSLKSSALASAPEGRLHADIRSFQMVPGRTPVGDGDFRYDQGRIHLKNLPQDLSQIHMSGTLRGDQLNMDIWNMNLGVSPTEGRFNVQGLFTEPVFHGEMRVSNLDLKNLSPASAAANQPRTEGVLSAELSVSGNGKTPEVIMPSLTGTGHFRIDKPIVRNLNVLNEILSKLSAIPGVSDALNQRMSDSLKERVARPDTELQTIDQNFTIDRGTTRLQKFNAVSPDIMIQGDAEISPDGYVKANPVVLIHQDIMAELVDRVHELAYALNSQGQLSIPLTVSGKAPQIQVLPDIQIILGEIVRNKAGEYGNQFVQKAIGDKRMAKLNKYLGVNTEDAPDNQQTTVASDAYGAPAGAVMTQQDNSVPVKVYPSSGGQTQGLFDAITGNTSSSGSSATPQNRKAQIAEGLLSAFLSSGSDQNSANGNNGSR